MKVVTKQDLKTFARTPAENGMGWIKLEFDKIFFIHETIIYCRFFKNWHNPTGWCVQSRENFKGCVNNENNVDVSVYQGELKQKSCGTLKLTYGLEQSDQVYTLLCNTRGDTVKLSKKTGAISVLEVVITRLSKLFYRFKPNRILGLDILTVKLKGSR